MWIERNLRFDLWLLVSALALVGLGVVMIYSTTSFLAERSFSGDGFFFLKRQAAAALIGLALMFAAMHLNYEKLRYFVWPLLLVTVVLLVVTLIPGIGHEVKGSRRWLRWGAFSFQPSELARLALVIFLAHSLARKQEKIKSFLYGFLPYLLVSGLVIGLIFVEPDLGGAITLGVIVLLMLFIAGTRLHYLLGLVALASPLVFYFMASAEYRWKRVMATINPWDYWHDAGWQLVQSLLAFGAGGVSGVGLGEGRQKLFYLPDAHTDFILAVIGEELGLIGVSAVIALFMVIAVRGALISMRASTLFGTYLAAGITIMFMVPALINMAVVTGLLPTKGLVLPFISYGGSALVIYLAAAGVLLNVSAKMYRKQ